MLNAETRGRTDCGKKRKNNEDQFLVAVLSRALTIQRSSLPHPRTLLGEEQGQLMIVADGMGGHTGGETASRIAVVAIEEFMLNTLKWFFGLRGDAMLEEFQAALQRADERIFESVEQQPELKGMGTTVTMAYAVGDVLYVAHAGDSRCYVLRGDQLYRVTNDYTVTAELISRGQDPAAMEHSPFRNLITNAVGGSQPGVRAEVHKVELEASDVVLLCSDGLTTMVTDDEIAAILRAASSPDAACQELIARANDLGGHDNITAVVARFDTPAMDTVMESAPATF